MRILTAFVFLVSFHVFAEPRLLSAQEPLGAENHKLHLRIVADDPNVELIRLTGSAIGVAGNYLVATTFFENVCRTPCDANVDARSSDRYVLTGEGVTPSDPFMLSSFRNGVTMNVKAGSRGLSALGGTTAGLGTLGLIGAISLFVTGLIISEPTPGPSSTRANLMNISAICGTAGLGLLFTGIGIRAASQTRYSLEQKSSASDAPSSPNAI
jgi:hypothetical protein